MKKKFYQYCLLLLCALIVSYVFTYIIYSLFTGIFNTANLGNTTVIALAAIVFVACILVFVYFVFIRDKKNATKNRLTTEVNRVNTGLENANWMTQQQEKKHFTTTTFDKLKNVDDGVVVRAEFHDLSLSQKKFVKALENKDTRPDNEILKLAAPEFAKKLHVTLAPPEQLLMVAAPGAGKTTGYIQPMLQILSKTKTQPSFFVADIKGELVRDNKKMLLESGYDVRVLDFKNPFESVKWNPLERIYKTYKRQHNLENEIIEHAEGEQPQDFNLSLIEGIEINDEGKPQYAYSSKHSDYWFEFDGKAFANREVMAIEIAITKRKLLDEVNEDLFDYADVLNPVTNKEEKMWESGSRGLIIATLQAMLEDSVDPKLDMSIDKFTFYNLRNILLTYDEEMIALRNYFNGRSKSSIATQNSRQALDSPDRARGSYLTTVADAMQMFGDDGICSLTSKNEINFYNFCDKPSALFLILPEDRSSREALAAMIVVQFYKELVRRGNTTDGSLPRSCYFLLDEFGNLPRIQKFAKMITLGRYHKVWFNMIFQNLSQLTAVYDINTANTIQHACGIQLFMGTKDPKTCEAFSKMCGNFSVAEYNSSRNPKDEYSTSAHTRERPLIYPTELANLNSSSNTGNVIALVRGRSPLKSKFALSYTVPCYNTSQSKDFAVLNPPFDRDKTFYDINIRNEKKLDFGKPTRKKSTVSQKSPQAVETESSTPKENHKEKNMRNLAVNFKKFLTANKEFLEIDENKVIQILSGTFNDEIDKLIQLATKKESNLIKAKLVNFKKEYEKLEKKAL